MNYFNIIIFIVWSLSFTQKVAAQVSYLSVDKPQQGKEITIYYKTISGALLNDKEPIFSSVNYWDEEGFFHRKIIKLSITAENTWSTVYKVPKNASYLNVRFYHLFKDDEKATINQIVYSEAVPAKGATYQLFLDAKLDQQFQDEIRRYPDNYFAYARYVNSLPADTLPSLLPKLLAQLTKVKNRDEGLLCALVVIYSKQAKKDVAYSTLLELLEKYPSSSISSYGLSSYLYEQYKFGGAMLATGELYDVVKNIFISYPQSAIAKENNNIFTFINDLSIPISVFENVLLDQYQDGMIDYNLLGVLPNLYLRRNIKLEEAERLLNLAINEFISGKIYHQYRLTPAYFYTYTTENMRTLSKVYLAQGRFAEAITALSAALERVNGSNFEGSVRPSLETELAATFAKAGNFTVALDLFKKIYQAGNERVRTNIEELYLKTADQVALDKFWAASDIVKLSISEGKLAPPFSGVELSGKKISLSDYKGKIVVINAWFIGCAPCIAEMPDLNKLVDQYVGQEDVVFLGITPDKSDALAKFLKHTKFKYTIINNVKGLEVYDISVYPQHIIIDQEGKIVYRTSGAVPGMADKLAEIIEQHKKKTSVN